MTKLTADAVRDIAKYVLFTDQEMTTEAIPDDAVIVDGIVCKYAFNPERLAEKSKDIGDLLSELPDEFAAKGGGGWSFLNACMDKHGEHWGEHPDMGMLFALGIGTKQASYLMPREMWPLLPGGVPYFVVNPAVAA